MKPRSAKAKGTLLEKQVSAALSDAGARSRRQPGSGVYSDFPADVYAEIPLLGPVLIECKSHKSPLATIRRWLGKATVLVHKANHEEPLVTMPLRVYTQMVAQLARAEQVLDSEIPAPPDQPITPALTQAECDLHRLRGGQAVA